ncbi:MAG: S8 family serine peptidase, partial [Acidimicrobiales bacterium]
MNRVSRNLLLAAAVGAATLLAVAPNATARPASPQTPLLGVIVTLHDAAADQATVAGVATDLLGSVGGQLGFVYTRALNGFSASLPQAVIATLLGDARVASIELDQVVHVLDTQPNPPSWGLDRVDQRNRPLDSSYTYNSTGAGVKAYVIDTGIEFGHPDLEGRAVSGFDSIDGGSADDCHGHGTHVSGTIGGATYGIAKQVQLVGVRVLDCGGSGTTSQVVAGIDWAIGDHVGRQPAVANMSLGGPADGVLD